MNTKPILWGAALGTLVSVAVLANDSYGNKTKPTTPTTSTHDDDDMPQGVTEPGSALPGTKDAQKSAMPGSRLPGVAQPRTADIAQLIADWPAASQKAAMAMATKYGQPTDVTASKLMWKDAGRFKRIAVMKEPVQHDFPVPHEDVLEQVIDYKVPADKADELAQFDGSLVVKRTRGELAATCDKEESNILALNLADDIVRGRRGVTDARDFMAKTTAQLANGERPAQATTLFVELFRSETEDRDRPAKAAMKGQKGPPRAPTSTAPTEERSPGPRESQPPESQPPMPPVTP